VRLSVRNERSISYRPPRLESSAPPSLAQRVLGSRIVWLGVGALLSQAAVAGYKAARDRGEGDLARPYAAKAQRLPLVPLAVKQSWLLEGDPKFASNIYAKSSDGRTLSGMWQVEGGPTKFVWTHEVDEWLHVIEGEGEIEYLGARYPIGPGSTAYFPAGAMTRWTVPNRIFKTFTLHDPERTTRWVRQALARPVE
jgi:uncharacterized cupin superfamily protein